VSSTYFPASADSVSALSEREDSAPSPFARLSHTQGPSSQSIGLKSPALAMSEPSQPQMSGQSMLFAEDSLASHLAMQESNWVQKMTVTSGLSILGLSKNCGQLGSLEKMLLASSIWASTTCLPIWKVSASPQGRLIYQLHPLERGIKEEDYGLWPTPKACDGIVRHSQKMMLKKWNSNGDVDLTIAVKMRGMLFPTPTANEDAAGRAGSKMQVMLGNHPLVRSSGSGTLNPTWVEWLMGFPKGWTDLGHSETRSSRKSRKSSGEQSYKPKGESDGCHD